MEIMGKKDKVIFTFWEPRRNRIPFIELCKKTWEKNLPDYEVVVLDYSNLYTYINKDTYDLSLLKQFRFPIQKDAVMVAVLKEHGGIFLDADTLVLKDITPLVNKLYNTEVIMFNMHLAFVAAHSNSLVLTLWLKGIQEKLKKSLENPNTQDELRWDFLGNSVLTEVMEAIISSSRFEKNMLTGLLDKSVGTCMNLEKKNIMQNKMLSNKLNRVKNFLLWKRRMLYYQTTLEKHCMMLNRDRYNFLPHLKYKNNKGMNAIDRYVNFWFDNNLKLDNVFLENQIVIGLQNSRTPDWYKELSEKEVLENSCLLSRTIKQILNN
jgi:hypothetical protein